MEKIKNTADYSEGVWQKGMVIITRSLYFVTGFILSGAGLFSMNVPLSTGFAATLTGIDFLFAALGAVFGSVVRLSGAQLINSLVPLAGMAGVMILCDKLHLNRKRKIIFPVCTGVLSLAVQTVTVFTFSPSLKDFLLAVCSSVVCGASVVFYSGATDCIKRKYSPFMLDNHSLICITVSLCTLLLGSAEISIMDFRPARLFGSFVTIAAAYLFGQSGGSIAGVCMGACVAVSGTSVALSLCYGICGLVSGVFSRYGQFVCALTFSLAAGVTALFDGSRDAVAVFAEAAVASIAFAAIPRKKLIKLRNGITDPKQARVSNEFSSARERLRQAATAIGSVSKCVEKVSEGIDAMSPARDITVIMRVRERVCSSCPLKGSFCPEEGEFAAVLKKLAQGDAVTLEDFSRNFALKCPSAPRIADSFNRVYSSSSLMNALQANSARNRELACGQFDWMSGMLTDLAKQIEDHGVLLFEKEKTAYRVLNEFGFEVKDVRCTKTVSGALRLLCTVKEIPAGTSLSRLAKSLSSELFTELSLPKLREVTEGVELLFLRKEIYKIRLGSASASCSNQKLCGDYYECFQTESKAYIILSDGMGTGGRAAIDSAMTVELFSRLIRAGLGIDTALSVTNSALSIKSDDESLSTLDVAEIDLYDGTMILRKSGAAPSFLSCDSRVKTVEMPSTPLGILSKVSFGTYTMKLRPGDMLVMVSDGILGCGNGWVTDEIKAYSGSTATDFSQLILNTARLKCGEKFDDMTVITAVIEEK